MKYSKKEITEKTVDGRYCKLFDVVVLVIIASIGIFGCRRAGSWLVTNGVPAHADAMLMLMGSIPDRILQTADLYNEGLADRLLIVQEGMGAYKSLEERGVRFIGDTEQAKNALTALGVPADSITVLPGDALSTLSEAIITGKYLTGNPAIDTLMIVTSATHSRRASMIFRTAFRKKDIPVCVITVPSEYSGFEPGKWWRRKEDIQKVLSEYVKIASFVFIEKKWLN